MTSFLVDDLLADEDFYGATASIITSASSKTSIALGHLLAARGRGPVIGLRETATSSGPSDVMTRSYSTTNSIGFPN